MAGISGQWLSVTWALSEAVRARIEWQVYLDSGCQLLGPCQRQLEPGLSGRYIWTVAVSYLGPIRGS